MVYLSPPHSPPLELLSCEISTLHKNMYDQALLRMCDSGGFTSSGLTSVPPCWSILISKIHPYPTLSSCKSTGTRSNTPSTPSAEWADFGKNRFLRHGGVISVTHLLDVLSKSRTPPPRLQSSRWLSQTHCPPTQNVWD